MDKGFIEINRVKHISIEVLLNENSDLYGLDQFCLNNKIIAVRRKSFDSGFFLWSSYSEVVEYYVPEATLLKFSEFLIDSRRILLQDRRV